MLKYTQTICNLSLILKDEINGLSKKEAYKAIRKNRRDNCRIEAAKYQEKWNYKKKSNKLFSEA